MRTEMLPRRARPGRPYVVCGFGVVPPGVRVDVSGWYTEPLTGRDDADADAVVDGFTTMHSFFRRNHARLWEAIARSFLGRPARVLRRATSVYRALLLQLRAAATEEERAAVLARVAPDEREALRRLDVPYFVRDTAAGFAAARRRAARIDAAAVERRVSTIRAALACA